MTRPLQSPRLSSRQAGSQALHLCCAKCRALLFAKPCREMLSRLWHWCLALAEHSVSLKNLLCAQLLEPATGQLVSLGQLADGAQALLVMWWCNHCPFVKHLKGAHSQASIHVLNPYFRP